jgi:hypothetical protein
MNKIIHLKIGTDGSTKNIQDWLDENQVTILTVSILPPDVYIVYQTAE